jgi:hypothetical protein
MDEEITTGTDFFGRLLPVSKIELDIDIDDKVRGVACQSDIRRVSWNVF